MTSKNSLAKAALLLGGASLLAVAVNAQSGQSAGIGSDTGPDWFTIRFQTSNSTGGTTTGTTGGTGGIITGATPRPLSEVTVINPGLLGKV